MDDIRAWTPPRGHADIEPTRFERLANDGYLTLDCAVDRSGAAALGADRGLDS